MTLLSRILAGAAIIAIFGLAVAGPPIARAGFGPFLGGGVAVTPPPIGLNHKGIDNYAGPIGAYGLTVYQAELAAWQGVGDAWGRSTVTQAAEDPSCTGTANINAATSGGVSDAQIFTAAKPYGITILYQLAGGAGCNQVGSPAWSAPSNPANWAAWAGSFAGQVSANGAHYYEIWNEEGAFFGWGGQAPSPATYTTLLCDAYTQIHNNDPSAVVIIGGLNSNYGNYPSSGSGTTLWYDSRYFLRQIYADGGGNCFDAVGTHPYNSNFSCTAGQMTLLGLCGNYEYDEVGNASIPDGNGSIESILVANNQSQKKIWATEIGCNTNPNGFGGSGSWCNITGYQGPYVTSLYSQASGGFGSTFMGPIFYWDEHDSYTSGDCTTSGNDCSGLWVECGGAVTSSCTLKAGGTAFAAASGTW